LEAGLIDLALAREILSRLHSTGPGIARSEFTPPFPPASTPARSSDR
jgi:hypothetical protein